MIRIPYHRPTIGDAEFEYVRQALVSGRLSGDGAFTKRCQAILESQTGTARALLTHSGTAGLELAALLGELKPGDEVIMPSYTFTSTANAFVLRGAVPVFVDIRPDTLNLDETLVEEAVTSRTRAIVPAHYAGVGCAMDTIVAIAERHGLMVIEDAAQALGSTYRGRSLGTFGQLGIISFHETKTVVCGEGGAFSSTTPHWRTVRRSSAKRAPTARRSFGGWSTGTRGWMLALRFCRATSSPPCFSVSWSLRTNWPFDATPCGTSTTRVSPSSRPRD